MTVKNLRVMMMKRMTKVFIFKTSYTIKCPNKKVISLKYNKCSFVENNELFALGDISVIQQQNHGMFFCSYQGWG